MAVVDKNIIITPNKSHATNDPQIVFSGADASTAAQNVTLKVYPYSGGTISIEGSSGQLFSVSNTMAGAIFSVNDISGMPSIEVLDTGVVKIAQYGGNVGLGTATPSNKLSVAGDMGITPNSIIGAGVGYANGTSYSSYATLQMYSAGTGYTTLNNQGYGIYLQTAGVARITIDNAGTVTIPGTLTATATTATRLINGTKQLLLGSVAAWNSWDSYSASDGDNGIRLLNNAGTSFGSVYGATGSIGFLTPSNAWSFQWDTVNNRFTGTLTATGGFSGNLTGNAATSTSTTYISSPDGDRLASSKLPTGMFQKIRYDFIGSGEGGVGSRYAGLMTYVPYDGASASTGDASYQLAFGGTAADGAGMPMLNIRKGINSTWNSWYTLLHSGNYTTYATSLPTLTMTVPLAAYSTGITMSLTADASTVNLLGINMTAIPVATTTSIRGYRFTSTHTGAIAEAKGLEVVLSTPNTTNTYGVYVTTAGGASTNTYGIYSSVTDYGSRNNYAGYFDLGDFRAKGFSRFDDRIVIGASGTYDGNYRLTVKGATLLSGTLNCLGNETTIRLNAQTIAADFTIPATSNGFTAGPITINNGVTVTITTGATWVIV